MRSSCPRRPTVSSVQATIMPSGLTSAAEMRKNARPFASALPSSITSSGAPASGPAGPPRRRIHVAYSAPSRNDCQYHQPRSCCGGVESSSLIRARISPRSLASSGAWRASIASV